MINRFKFLPSVALAAIALSTGACSSVPDEEIISNFVESVNNTSSSTDIHASVEGNSVVLDLKLEDTPENEAKLLILQCHDKAIEVFENKIVESLKEGKTLARFVYEKKDLSFRVSAGNESFTLTVPHQHIRQTAFKNM